QRFALLVSGSPCGAAPELLWELAEGMSFIVAVDSGADWLCAANLIPDLIVGDLDSCSAESLRILREQEVEELVYPTAKDATDLELALAEVAQRDYGNLVATNILGGRSDHALAALGNLVQAVQRGLAVTVVEPTETIIILSAASPHDHLTLDFADGLEAGQAPTISLIPWGGPAEVSASGFQWQLDHATLSPLQSLGVSNLPVAAQPRIDLHQGDLLVIVQVPAF
ncbi:MAG: thiamine diphosphokinase, partial [Coriobacteriia bacterium]|nr:thiamine diphosphokinase [Coriobacteriia bacterium]